MTKLLISIATLGSGGAERVLSTLSKPLAENFDEVQYMMWDGGEVFYEIDKRVKTVSLPELSGRVGRTKQLQAFRKYVKKERPDLILSFLTPYNMLALIATLGVRQKIVVAERTDPKRLISGGKPMLWLRDLLYRRATGILTQTEYAKSCYGGKLASKTKVIYNPVMMSEEQVGKALRTEKDNTMVSVGRLEPVKDQVTMIDAFGVFHESHPDYRLVIYGEGPAREELENKVKSLGLQDCVELPGRSNQVWDKMVSADCFLLTSLAEGMSNAMIEALCLGLPVISTKVAGSTDFIKDGVNGYLVDMKDSETLAKRMCQIANNAELKYKMSAEAVKAYEELRANKITKQWVEYLASFMKKNNYDN